MRLPSFTRPVTGARTRLVCGATFVWASIVAGPGIAAHALVQGFLGNAIITYVFVRQLRAM